MTSGQSTPTLPADEPTAARGRATMLRHSLAALGGYGVAGIGGFLLGVVVGRALDPKGAGAFYTVVAVSTIAMYVVTFGADTGLLRSVARARALGQTDEIRPTLHIALLPSLGLSCIVGIAFIAASPLLGRTLTPGVGSATALWIVVGVSLPASLLAFVVLHGAMRGLGSITPLLTLWQIGLPLTRLVAALIAAGVVGSLLATVLSWSALPVPIAVIAVVLLRRRTRSLPPSASWLPAAAQWRTFWSFAAARGAAQCFEICVVWLDVIMMTVIRGSAQAGVYAAASRFITTGTLAVQATRIAVAPQLASALAHDDRSRASALYRTSTVLVVLLSWPLFLALVIFAPTILSIFGPGFVGGATALRVIGCGMLFYTAVGNVSAVLLMGGKSRWTAMNVGAALLTNLVANLILIPPYGATGAAISWVCSIAVDTGLSLYQVTGRMSIRGHGQPFWQTAAVAALVFGGGGLVARAVFPQSVSSVAVILAVLLVIYAGGVLTLRRSVLLTLAR